MTHMQFSADSGSSPLSKIFDPDNQASIRLIADAMPQIVWIADPNGNIEYFNQAWLDFTGHALEASLGDGWQSVLHPDDLEQCRTRWLKAVQSGTALETECRFRRASDGAYRWHLIRAHALKDDAGAVIKWVGSGTDINDQKVAQQALHDAVADVERQVKERTAELLTTNMQLLDAISERRQAAAIHEQDTRRLNDIIATQALLAQAELNLPSFLNLAAQKIHRLTGATGTVVELIEKNDLVSAAATGSTAPFVGFRVSFAGSLSGLCIRKRQVLKCDNASEDPRVDLKACLKVGAVSLLVAPLYNKGIAIGVLKVLSDAPNAFGQRDVQTLEMMAGLLGAAIAQQVHMQSSERLLAERTEALSALQMEVENRLRSEQQLHEVEHRMRLILESSHDAFFSVNTDGVIVEWNDQAEAVFGWSRREAMGKQFAQLLIPADARAGLGVAIERVIRSGESAAINERIEAAALHRLGRPLSIELSISSLHDSGAQIVNFFVRDISARKRIEAAMARKDEILRKIADVLPAWIAYIDRKERYRYANAHYFTDNGINAADLIGRTLLQVVGQRRYAAMKGEIGQVMSGMEVRYERTIETKNGPVRQHVCYLPDKDENGSVLGFYSIVTKVGESVTKVSDT